MSILFIYRKINVCFSVLNKKIHLLKKHEHKILIKLVRHVSVKRSATHGNFCSMCRSLWLSAFGECVAGCLPRLCSGIFWLVFFYLAFFYLSSSRPTPGMSTFLFFTVFFH